MEDERIIIKEAIDFYSQKIDRSKNRNAIEDFKDIKSRLQDFYSNENKALFLNQIEMSLNDGLILHRKKAHNGLADPNCQMEIKAEKLLFYIKQELNTLPIIARQKFEEKVGVVRNKVFVSYAHSDKEMLIDVQRHFKPFLDKIDFWDDSKITPGQKWKEEIQNAIVNTKIAILIVSTDFLGSEFISSNELPPLLEAAEKEGAVILIIIYKPCLFEEFTELNQFQALNNPSRPYSKMDQNEREELLVNLVRQTKRILDN